MIPIEQKLQIGKFFIPVSDHPDGPQIQSPAGVQGDLEGVVELCPIFYEFDFFYQHPQDHFELLCNLPMNYGSFQVAGAQVWGTLPSANVVPNYPTCHSHHRHITKFIKVSKNVQNKNHIKALHNNERLEFTRNSNNTNSSTRLTDPTSFPGLLKVTTSGCARYSFRLHTKRAERMLSLTSQLTSKSRASFVLYIQYDYTKRQVPVMSNTSYFFESWDI